MKNKLILLALLTSFVYMGCEKVVEGLNEDPNNPQNAPENFILTGAQVANILVQEGELARLTGMWSGYFTGYDRQYVSLGQYVSTTGDADSPWGNLYAGVVQQSNIIIDKATTSQNRLTRGLARLLKAHALGTATAVWGDVPYTQAGDVEAFPNPVYDSQATVYDSLQILLDNAIADFQSGQGNLRGDVHGLSAAAWTEVAYTLKARFYMHTKSYSLAAAAAANGISSAANNMMAPHGTTYLGDFNVYYSFLVYDRSGYMSAVNAFVTTILDPAGANYRGNAKTDETARFSYLFYPAAIYTPYEPNFLSVFDWGAPDGFFGTETDFPLVTFEENKLILAEAHARVTADLTVALGHLNDYRAYLNGGGYINTDWGTPRYDAYDITDFDQGGIENPGTTFTRAQALLKEILEERYITFIGQIEGFNDIRRTRGEAVAVNPTPVTGNQLPERLLYPQSEINSNTSTPNPIPGLFDPTPVNQ